MNLQSLAAWLIMQPARTQIEWFSWNLTADEPWSGGWVDIRIPAFREGSCLTFIPPHHSAPATEANLHSLERDLDVHAIYAPAKRWFVQEIALPKGQSLLAEQEQLLNEAQDAHPDSERGIRGGWSAERLSQGLREWAGRFAGRSDLRWVWDSQAGLPPALQALLEAAQADIEPTYEIMPGVKVTEQAFSVLATMPRRSQGRAHARSMPGTDFGRFDPFAL